MASWQDGAEYAPIERPDGFAMPVADQLEQVTPEQAATPGAIVAPNRYDEPTAALALDSIAPTVVESRNPNQPFDVASAIIASDSAWGAAHQMQTPTFAPAWDPMQPMGRSAEEFPPPSPQMRPLPPPNPWEQPVSPGPAAMPQVPQWAPPAEQPREATRPNRSQVQIVLSSAGLIVLGGLLPALAVFALLVSSLLLGRVSQRTSGTLVMAMLVVFGLRILVGDADTSNMLVSVLCFGCLVPVLALLARRDRNN